MTLASPAEIVPLTTDADGVIKITGTRVPLDTVVAAFKAGSTSDEIALDYPTLELADIYSVLSYYLRHQRDLEFYLEERRQKAIEVRKANEARLNPQELRQRLLARLSR